jgi:hypothetical protein
MDEIRRRDARAGRPYSKEPTTGCRGKETDILAVFEPRVENAKEHRFALHIEVKRRGDTFGEKQGEAALLRAGCWADKAPDRVLPHERFGTIALFSEADRVKHAEHLGYFDAEITIEELAVKFPNASPPLGSPAL